MRMAGKVRVNIIKAEVPKASANDNFTVKGTKI